MVPMRVQSWGSKLPMIAQPPTGATVRRAVIDVGTNSVKLLVADVADGTVQPLLERSEQTRLGRGFYETRRLQPDAIRQTTQAIAGFATLAARFQPESTRVVATSAAREALNQAELIDTVERETGLRMEIISGETEADWAFRGVTTDPALAEVPLLIIDVGGGSTEFILGQGLARHFQRSLPMGSVRLLERFPVSDPPTLNERNGLCAWLDQFLAAEVEPELRRALNSFVPGSVRLVGTGGTGTILARMQAGLAGFDRTRIEATRLRREDVRAETTRLWNLSLAERKKIVSLPPNRADVILIGAAIYLAIMERFDFSEASVSTRGLRFAAVLDRVNL